MSKKRKKTPPDDATLRRAEAMTVHREKRRELWERLTAVSARPEQYVEVMRLYTIKGPAAAEARVVEIEDKQA